MNKLFTPSIILAFILFRISACNSDSKEFHIVENTELEITVKKTFMDRGIIYLNDAYFLRSWCGLITPPPNWLKKSIYQYNENKTRIDFEIMKPPFRFIKHKGEKEFYVIKNQDTLKFRLENSYE